ncbi:hypothetical protein [Brumimicrobium mesophilum]|uniref:hypothetical protein n=1 Tax=Brumimicrobium mesophilum TaxID=392717 RepID=UPI000D14393C|nr:hypothetical protein [Brumimicrobium mesophilum]
MRFYYIIIALLISCTSKKEELNDDKKQQEEFDYYLEEVLENRYEEITFFEDSCLDALQKGYIYSNVWEESYYLWEGCSFEPKKEILLNPPSNLQDYNFVAYFIERQKDSSFYTEVYARNKNFDSYLIPLRFEEHDKFSFDSTYSIAVHLEGGIECADLYMTGTEYTDTMKLGIYQKVRDPKINKYVDSMILVRDSSMKSKKN